MLLFFAGVAGRFFAGQTGASDFFVCRLAVVSGKRAGGVAGFDPIKRMERMKQLSQLARASDYELV